MSIIASYLVTKYKGVYRLKAPINQKTNQFLRDYNGNFSENDVYIDCSKGVMVFHYGKNILEAYIPTIGRGRNMVKNIKEEYGEDIIFNIIESDSEVTFRFKSDDMDKLEKYLKPKTSGASISPFSTKNLPKTDYNIPENDLLAYKSIVEKIDKNRILELTHSTQNYLKSLANKKNTWEDIKADMTLKGLKGKEYIHSINKWSEYIEYLNNNL